MTRDAWERDVRVHAHTRESQRCCAAHGVEEENTEVESSKTRRMRSGERGGQTQVKAVLRVGKAISPVTTTELAPTWRQSNTGTTRRKKPTNREQVKRWQER